MNDLPPFIERSVFGGQNQPGPDQQQPRSYEPRQPRHGQDGRPEHRDRGDGGRSEGRGDGRGPRRRGRYDNGGGRPRQHNQDRQPMQDTAASDVNGAAFVEPARRDNPEPKDGD